MEHEHDIETLVIGAGFSGLAYAHFSAHDDTLVLEASPRAGGLVRTVEVEPDGVGGRLRIEAGPETVSDPSGAMRALAHEVGVEVAAPQPNATRRFVVRRGELADVPMSPPAMFGGSFLPVSARLRLMTEPLRATRVALDGSIADFVRHRLGGEVLEALVDPLIGGIYGGDPEQLSMRACFPQVVEGVEEHGSLFRFMSAKRASASKSAGAKKRDKHPWKPVGGMAALTNALAGERVRFDTTVESLERADDGAWRVHAEHASDLVTYRAHRVVLALPLRATARLLASAAPDAARALEQTPSESIASIAHAYRASDVAHALDGFGYLVPHREGLSHLGTLFPSSLDPSCAPEGVVLLRTMVGGARHPQLTSASDDELERVVRDEVRPLLGIEAAPLWLGVERYEHAFPRYDLGHVARVEAVGRGLPDGLSVLGNHQHGIGLSSLLVQARTLAERHRERMGSNAFQDRSASLTRLAPTPESRPAQT